MMQAYLGDPELKAQLLDQIRQHEAADQIVKGTYGAMHDVWKGCAIGCALHSLNRLKGKPETEQTNDHARFPTELGIPVELAHLIDHLFENLPTKESQSFPYQVAEAITPGADLSGVLPTLLQWSILDPMYGWIVYAKTDEQRATLQQFAQLVAQDWAGETVSAATWNALDAELDTIPEWAGAWAGAGARAWAWAWAGAWAWAWAGARAWAWAGAEYGAYYRVLSGEFVRLLREAEVRR